MAFIQIKKEGLHEGRAISNRELFPKNWKSDGGVQYRFVYRDSYGDDRTSDTWKSISCLTDDPLWFCSSNDERYTKELYRRM